MIERKGVISNTNDLFCILSDKSLIVDCGSDESQIS